MTKNTKPLMIIPDMTYGNVMHDVIVAGDALKLALLLQNGVSPNNHIYNKSVKTLSPLCSPLSLAALVNQLEICHLLIENGAKVESQLLITDTQTNILHLLLEHGADPNFISENEFFTLPTPLMHACSTCRHDLVKLLLSYDVDIHRQDTEGSNALHYVTRSNGPLSIRLDLIKILLASGIDPHTKDKYGFTAKMLTFEQEIRELL